MEYMALAEFVRYGTPVLLMALVVVNVYQSTVLRELARRIERLAENVVYRDTCDAHRREVEHRLVALERRRVPRTEEGG